MIKEKDFNFHIEGERVLNPAALHIKDVNLNESGMYYVNTDHLPRLLDGGRCMLGFGVSEVLISIIRTSALRTCVMFDRYRTHVLLFTGV